MKKFRKVKLEEFGKDHWSTFAFIETRCVDHKGQPDLDRMRCNTKRHPGLIGAVVNRFGNAKWKPEYSTRLKGHFQTPNQINGHDDHDVADDLALAGLIEVRGTGIHPWYKMTKLGTQVASMLREHKAKGGNFADFEYAAVAA